MKPCTFRSGTFYSRAPEEIEKAYTLGASSFITKPLGYHNLVEMAKKVTTYWFKTVSLPPK